MKKIYVDADACPVKDEIIKVSTRHKIQVFMVCNGGIRPFRNNLINLIIVPEGSDEADKWIFANVKTKDIVITSDITLASKCVAKGASVLKHNGLILNVKNIGNVQAIRDLMSDLRSSNPFLIEKSKSFTKADKGKFLNSLETLIIN
tara:strand:+ start:200 stop:640 length:441 start_codon:yes stop_codon:yes gene_type:complete